jgi:predicted nucleic acid-binding protein
MGVILDTSVLIAAENQRLDLHALFAAHEKETFCIAAITAAELLHGVERAKPAARKQTRARFVEMILDQVETIDFDLALARQHAGIRAKLEAAGRVIGPYDLLIAATALHYNHPVATLNVAEFRQVPALRLIDVARYLRSEATPGISKTPKSTHY